MAVRIAKVVHQSAAAECGLACAAMILQAHGIDVQLQQIRQTHDVSLRGSSLRDLLTLIGDYGLAARPMRVEIDRLQQAAQLVQASELADHRRTGRVVLDPP